MLDHLHIRKNEKKHQKPIQYDSHYNIADEQSDIESLPIDDTVDLLSTHLDVSSSSEQACNANSKIQAIQEYILEENKRVLTTSKRIIPEDKNRSTKIEGASKKSHNVTRNDEKQEKEIKPQNNDENLDEKEIGTVIKSICGLSGVAQFRNITQHNVPTKNMNLKNYYSRDTAIQPSVIAPDEVPTLSKNLQDRYLHGSATQSSVIDPYSVSTQVMNLQDDYSCGRATQSRKTDPNNVPTQNMNFQDHYHFDSATQSRHMDSHNVPIPQSRNLHDYPDDSATQSQNTTLHSLSSLGEIAINAINSLKEKSQSLKNCKSELETEVKEIIPATVVLSSSECSYIGNPNISSNDEKESTDLSEWDVVDDNIQNELTNVDHETVTVDELQNQLSFFSREELQEKDKIFVDKGHFFADKLRNLPKDLSKEAEEKISHILYKSEYESYARMKKMQVILMNHN